tara:strand:+ start:2083 stop:2601 length:519 start_codon:yes stop_codon:yes gene_type:complete
MKNILLLLLLVFIDGAWAKMLKHQISGRQRSLFSYQQVCRDSGVKHLPLISVASTFELDCMGTTVNVQEFCQKKFKNDKTFLRGFISKAMEEVVCEKGEALEIALACDKEHLSYCRDPKLGCANLKNIFAFNLEVGLVSLVEKDVDNTLNCIFQTKSSVKENDFSIDEMLKL